MHNILAAAIFVALVLTPYAIAMFSRVAHDHSPSE